MRHVQHAEILDVRTVAQTNKVHITPNDRMKPDTTVLTHHHIADDDPGVFNKAGLRNGWPDALKGS